MLKYNLHCKYYSGIMHTIIKKPIQIGFKCTIGTSPTLWISLYKNKQYKKE